MVEYWWNFCVRRTYDKLSHLTAVSVGDSKPSVCFSLSLSCHYVYPGPNAPRLQGNCAQMNVSLKQHLKAGGLTTEAGKPINCLSCVIQRQLPDKFFITIQGQYVGFSVIYCYGCSVANNQPLRSCPHGNIIRLKR